MIIYNYSALSHQILELLAYIPMIMIIRYTEYEGKNKYFLLWITLSTAFINFEDKKLILQVENSKYFYLPQPISISSISVMGSYFYSLLSKQELQYFHLLITTFNHCCALLLIIFFFADAFAGRSQMRLHLYYFNIVNFHHFY